MVSNSLLILALLTLCCSVATMHGFAGCSCLRMVSDPIPFRAIKKIEIIPISGNCRHPETILTMRNGFKVCINPEKKWFNNLLRRMQKRLTAISTIKPQTSFQTSF